MRIGYFLSSEEFTPAELVEQARLASSAGFTSLWISDHYHPWTDAQGNSPFVWSVVGALSAVGRLPVTTAVTCPTVRIHPAVVAQAAATSAVMHDGRFVLGVGSGEALNEHILGDPWPGADVRLDMLEEAVIVMRMLWEGGFVNYHGKYYTVENARLYTLPEEMPKVYVSGIGPKSIELAAQLGDGFISVAPDAEAVSTFHKAGGEGKPTQAGCKVCYAPTAEEALDIAYERWPNSALPGELSQVLPSPRHFEQASQLVTREMVGKRIVCGPDADAHLELIDKYVKAGFDDIHVANIGPYQAEFFDFYRDLILPQLTV